MKWNDSYSLGIDKIDEQHRIIIEAISSLETSLLSTDQKQRWTAIHYALITLQDFARIHFTMEEALMDVMHYPDVDHHTAQHRSFSTHIARLQEKSLKEPIEETEILEYLRDWMVKHIQTEDRKYAEHFKRRCPESASPAS